MNLTREFKNSLFISFFMHALAFLIFNVNLYPKKITPFKNTEISFYGQLLGDYDNKGKSFKTGVDFSLKDRLDSVIEKKVSIFMDTAGLRKESLYIFPEKPFKEKKIEEKHSVYTEKTGEKEVVPSFNDKIESKISFLPPVIGGIKSSEESRYSVISEEEGMIFKLRFFVSSEGVVEFVEPHLFSGNPDLDIFVKKLVKEMIFLPHYDKRGEWYEVMGSYPQIIAKRDD